MRVTSLFHRRGSRSRFRGADRAAATALARATAAIVVALASGAAARPSHAPVNAAFGERAAVVSTSAGMWIRPAPDAPFEYLCPRAAGADAGAFEPRVAVRDDEIFVATHRDIRAGRGCELEPVALVDPAGKAARGRWIESVSVAADGVVWLASADGVNPNDVYRLDGDRFVSAGLHSDRRWYLSALPSPSRPAIVYASGYQAAPLGSALLRHGPTGFVELRGRDLVWGANRRSRFVAVAPGDPEVALLSVETSSGDVLYATRDGGESFEQRLAPGARITGVVAAGGAVWASVAGPCPGKTWPGCVYRLAPTAATFAGPALTCLVRDGRRLVGCRADALSSGVALVELDPDTGAQTPALLTSALHPPCQAQAARCAADWQRACKVLGAPCAATGRPTPPEPPPPQPPRRNRVLLWVLLVALVPLPWLLSGRR